MNPETLVVKQDPGDKEGREEGELLGEGDIVSEKHL